MADFVEQVLDLADGGQREKEILRATTKLMDLAEQILKMPPHLNSSPMTSPTPNLSSTSVTNTNSQTLKTKASKSQPKTKAKAKKRVKSKILVINRDEPLNTNEEVEEVYQIIVTKIYPQTILNNEKQWKEAPKPTVEPLTVKIEPAQVSAFFQAMSPSISEKEEDDRWKTGQKGKKMGKKRLVLPKVSLNAQRNQPSSTNALKYEPQSHMSSNQWFSESQLQNQQRVNNKPGLPCESPSPLSMDNATVGKLHPHMVKTDSMGHSKYMSDNQVCPSAASEFVIRSDKSKSSTSSNETSANLKKPKKRHTKRRNNKKK